MSNRVSSDFSRLITTKSITIGFDGETRTVRKEDPAYKKLLQAIQEERWDDIPELLKPEEAVSVMSDGEMRVESGQVFVKNPQGEFAVPSRLNSTILFYMENKLPFKPLVNFATNLSQNPSNRSVDQLFSFLEHNNFTITEEGKFIAYKGVTKEFLDCHTRTIDNSVGMTIRMPRDQVNDDPNQTCSHGLHVASYDYAHNHYGSGSAGVTLCVEVDPRHVVAVPVDYNNAKMRVCEYKVLSISQGEYKKPIYDYDDEDSFEEEGLEEDEDLEYIEQ